MSTTLVVVGFEMFITDALRTGVVVGRKNFEKLGHYEKPNEKKASLCVWLTVMFLGWL